MFSAAVLNWKQTTCLCQQIASCCSLLHALLKTLLRLGRAAVHCVKVDQTLAEQSLPL